MDWTEPWLRAGGSGAFSVPTTETNYALTLAQVALESPNPNASRLVGMPVKVTLAGLTLSNRMSACAIACESHLQQWEKPANG